MRGLHDAELSDAEISERMSGNICRCAAYPNIVDAIREVAGMGDRDPVLKTAAEIGA